VSGPAQFVASGIKFEIRELNSRGRHFGMP
jgi:hypothetical protein